MEELFLHFCTYMQLNFDMNGNACNNAIRASYTQSGANKNIDLLQSTEQQKITAIMDNNKEFIYPAIGAGFIWDAYKKQEIKLSTPIPSIIDTIGVDLTPIKQSYTLNCKWIF